MAMSVYVIYLFGLDLYKINLLIILIPTSILQ